MSSTAFAAVLAAAAGLAGAVQIAVQGRLNERVGSIEAAATASVIGATTYVLLELFYGPNHLNRLIGIGVTLGLRVLAIRWKVSLPEFPK